MRTTRGWARIAGAVWTGAALAAGVFGGEAAFAEPGVFDRPRIEAKHRQVEQGMMLLALHKRMADAETLLENALQDPDTQTAHVHYNLACIRAVLGKPDAALATLAQAVDMGFTNAVHMRNDPDLVSLRPLPRFAELLEAAARKGAQAPSPGAPVFLTIRAGVAAVTASNTVWAPALQRFFVLHAAPADTNTPVILLYDNRDRAHSRMDLAPFPRMARIVYDEAVRKEGLDRGAQTAFVHNLPTLGNASLANTSGPYWRSMSRMLYQEGRQVQMLADQYANNHLYVYVEHKDHDPSFGDVFALNTPYVITSQGSSGSDKPFLQAVAETLHAFPDGTYRFLATNNILMPTVQMILRASRKPVVNPEDYLTGPAHPPVFDSQSLDVPRMTAMARALEPGQAPPLVRLFVEEEDDDTRPGVDYFEVASAEKLADTPSAIARAARATRRERRLVVSAGRTRDPNGRPLTFHWRVLNGDAARVRIEPLDAAGTRAELRVAWHERGVRAGGTLPNSRVDIGVFAHNGVHYSAPAFVTWYFPANEKRTYAEDGRILSIAYLSPSAPASYVDPALVTPADWTDTYQYTPDGRLLGWQRKRGDTVESYTRDGALVVERDAQGRPALARPVAYRRVQESPKAWPALEPVAGETAFPYHYLSDEDLFGVWRGQSDSSPAPCASRAGPRSFSGVADPPITGTGPGR